MASGERRLELRVAFKRFESACHRSRQSWGLDRGGADYEEPVPLRALVIGGHSVWALEDRLLDPAVGGDLDRVPDGKPFLRDQVVALVDAPIDGQLHRLGLSGGPQPSSVRLDRHRVQLKLESMNGRERVEAA